MSFVLIFRDIVGLYFLSNCIAVYRDDAKYCKIKKAKKAGGATKFKVRCSRVSLACLIIKFISVELLDVLT